MPKRHTIISTRKRKPPKGKPLNKRAPKKQGPNTKIFLSKRDEAFLKARALEKYGFYSPKKLDYKKFTPSQAKHVNKLFDRVQSRGVFDKGKVIRPFSRTLNGYEISQGLKYFNIKAAQKISNAIPSNTGAIVPKTEAKNIKVRADGTVTFMAKRKGKMRKVFMGTLSPKQSLEFIEKLQKGEWKMPKGMEGRIIMFGADTINGARYFDDPSHLLSFVVNRYGADIRSLAEKYPHSGTITLEFFRA